MEGLSLLGLETIVQSTTLENLTTQPEFVPPTTVALVPGALEHQISLAEQRIQACARQLEFDKQHEAELKRKLLPFEAALQYIGRTDMRRRTTVGLFITDLTYGLYPLAPPEYVEAITTRATQLKGALQSRIDSQKRLTEQIEFLKEDIRLLQAMDGFDSSTAFAEIALSTVL